MQWERGLRYVRLRFVRLKATPHEISLGFAFGVFWGMFPLPGLQMATAILTAALFRSNKLAAAAGTWLTNPLTTLPFTALNFHVGQTVLGREWSNLPLDELRSLNSFLTLGSEVITGYLMGCFVVGVFAAILSYFIGLSLIPALQKRIQHQQIYQQQRKVERSLKGGSHHSPP